MVDALLADPPAALGAELDVYVLRAQVADARLRVTLRPPAGGASRRWRGARPRENSARRRRPTPGGSTSRVGDALSGTVLRTARCGAFVDVGCLRRGGGGAPRRDALLPPDQQQAEGAPPRAGAALDVRVLEPLVARGGRCSRRTPATPPRSRAASPTRAARRGCGGGARRRARSRSARSAKASSSASSHGALVNVGARGAASST